MKIETFKTQWYKHFRIFNFLFCKLHTMVNNYLKANTQKIQFIFLR